MQRCNRIIVDITKAQWARLWYKNQHGDCVNIRPKEPTVFAQPIQSNAHVFGSQLSMLEYATREKLLDVWTPVCRFKLTAHECLDYTGEKAVTLYKAWCERIFKKK